MTYKKVKTWQEAVKAAEEANEKEKEEYAKIEGFLGDLLNEAQPDTGKVQGKPFYTSKMRTKAIMQNATKVELQRVVTAAEEMLKTFY